MGNELTEIIVGGNKFYYLVDAERISTTIYDEDKLYPIIKSTYLMSERDVAIILDGYNRGKNIGLKLGRARLQTEIKLALEY